MEMKEGMEPGQEGMEKMREREMMPWAPFMPLYSTGMCGPLLPLALL